MLANEQFRKTLIYSMVVRVFSTAFQFCWPDDKWKVESGTMVSGRVEQCTQFFPLI